MIISFGIYLGLAFSTTLKESVKEEVAKRTGGDVAVRVWDNGEPGKRSMLLCLQLALVCGLCCCSCGLHLQLWCMIIGCLLQSVSVAMFLNLLESCDVCCGSVVADFA